MSKEADYIVVGAGSAGCVVANRLSADPSASVILLEAGPKDRHPFLHVPAGTARVFVDPRYNWMYQTEPDPSLSGRSLYYPRGKTLGGSSAINGMAYVRGVPSDYDSWAATGNAGWGWDDVLPLFRRSETNSLGATEAHSVDGELQVRHGELRHPFCSDVFKAAESMGFRYNPDFNDGEQEGFGWVQHTIANGRRSSTAQAFLAPIKSRKNLCVEANAMVERVQIANGRATAVQVRQNGVSRIFRARKEIILSGGVIGSPQILMLSGLGPGAHLQEHGIDVIHDLPGMGKNLQDHMYTHFLPEVDPASSINGQLRMPGLVWQALKYGISRRGLLAMGVTNAALYARTNPDEKDPDIQIMIRPNSTDFAVSGKLVIQKRPGATLAICKLRPKSRGQIMLRSADPRDNPAIHLNAFSDPSDVATHIRGVRLAEKLLATEPVRGRIKRMQKPDRDISTDELLESYIRDNAVSVFHPVGTCKMGNDAMAVVDHRLRVRGVDGLRVADAAIMPQIVSGNTNAPAIMIGEKCADLIREDRRA